MNGILEGAGRRPARGAGDSGSARSDGEGPGGIPALIGSAAVAALLYEAAADPKPGLVTPSSKGAHRDMDYLSFLASAAALSPWFAEFARLGFAGSGEDPASLLPPLRRAGIAAERAMLRATGGVNTHKGLIFSLGILCASAGRLAAAGVRSDAAPCARVAAEILRGIVDRDFADLGSRDPAALSAGERLHLRHGTRGARGEAEAGFPSILERSLPKLKAGLSAGLDMNDALVDTLLELLSFVEDTNVLNRGGHEGLELVRKGATSALGLGGISAAAGRAAIDGLCRLCVARNLSPGGCADLLAVTCFLQLLPGALARADR